MKEMKSIYKTRAREVILDREDFDFDEVEAYSAVQRALNNCEHDDEKACVDEYGIVKLLYDCIEKAG